MSQEGREFLDSQASYSQGSYGSEGGSNRYDLNDSFVNNSHISSSQYSSSEREYSGWSSGSSNYQPYESVDQPWCSTQISSHSQQSESYASTQSTVILSQQHSSHGYEQTPDPFASLTQEYNPSQAHSSWWGSSLSSFWRPSQDENTLDASQQNNWGQSSSQDNNY